jgi:CYTH domain-containing protein
MFTLEYELTFLAAFLPPGLSDCRRADIVDIYQSDIAGTISRARQLDSRCLQTTKTRLDPADASAQREETTPLSAAEFDHLASCGYPQVRKTRYWLPNAGQIAEIDVFGGMLVGLVLIEFEFDQPPAQAGFVPPTFCLADVTQEDFVAGRNLVGRSYADITSDLARFGYSAL